MRGSGSVSAAGGYDDVRAAYCALVQQLPGGARRVQRLFSAAGADDGDRSDELGYAVLAVAHCRRKSGHHAWKWLARLCASCVWEYIQARGTWLSISMLQQLRKMAA